jgi:hypothetical protein
MHLMVMKHRMVLLILFFGITLFAEAQSTVKLYGYTQRSTPGIAGRERDENGQIKKPANNNLYSYFIYLTGPSKSRMYPAELWIRGERLGVKAETVLQTPVEITKDNVTTTSEKVTLVPKTTAKVLQLTGTRETPGKKFIKAKNLATTNELVVVYKLNGKFYYATLKKFTSLNSVALQ